MTAPATTVSVGTRPRTRPRAAWGAALIAALGCAVLAARPALVASTREPARVLVAVFVVLFVVGLSVPLHEHTPRARAPRAFVFATSVGLIGFLAGRVLIGGHAPGRLSFYAIAVNVLAAVAEEVWFRRLCYGLLEPAGTGFAIAMSSMLFAAVHVSIYGWSVVPLDIGAGAVLGWQRATTGSWTSPALTHALANVFILL